MTIPPSVRRLLHYAGVDRAVGVTLFARVVALFSAPITLIFQLRYLTENQQGYFVTFTGIIGLIALLELGLTQAIAIFAGHEMAALKWDEDGALSGSSEARARLRWLLRFGTAWYGGLAIFLILILLPFGFWYYATFGKLSTGWQWPWLASVIVGAANLFVFTPIAILENAGMITQVAVMRLQQTLIGNLISWSVLALGGGLFALPAMNAGTLLVTTVALWRWRRRLGSIARSAGTGAAFRFWHEIWPLQWRLGVNWLGGYSTNYLVPLAVFTVCGDAVAGQFGLSSQLAAAIQNLSLTWITAQLPRFMKLVAQAKWAELDAIYLHRSAASLIVMVLGAVSAWFLIWIMNSIDFKYAQRFVSPLPFAILVANTTIVTLSAILTFYIRAHKTDPLYLITFMQGLLLPAAVFAVAGRFGISGVALCMMIASSIVLGFASYYFRATRREHQAPAALSE